MTVHNSMGVVGKDGTGAAVPLVTPADVRATLSALTRRRATTTRPNNGRLKGGRGADLTVSAGTGWTYVVEPGAAILSTGPVRGADIVVSDTTVTLTTDPAPSSGSSRIDVVYIAQKDAFDGGNDETRAVIGLARGVPATSNPGVPDIPPGAVIIGQNVMQSSATSTGSTGNSITNPLGFTSLAGGIGLYGSLAELQNDDSRDRGAVGFNTADGHLYVKTNTASGAGAAESPVAIWDDLPRVRSRQTYQNWDGGALFRGGQNQTFQTVTITVPAGRRAIIRANVQALFYTASTSNYAGNLYIDVDGVSVQATRFHNQGRSGMQTYGARELGFDVGPGTHTIKTRIGADSASITFETWFCRAEIVAEW